MTTQYSFPYGRLVILTVLCSIALSIWCVWADPVVNNDGIYYFRAAREIAKGDWYRAAQIFSWLPYPGLIALVRMISGVGEQAAAHLIDAFFYCVLVVGFLAVVRQLGADARTLVLAAVLILFFPTLNKYRSFVIRDIAYLAFYMWSLFFLFRYCACGRKKQLLWWSLLTAGSVMFRVEGLALLVTVPLALYTLNGITSKFRWGMAGLYVVCASLLGVVMVSWVYRNYVFLGDPGEHLDVTLFMRQAWDSLSAVVTEKMRILSWEFSPNHAGFLYIAIIVLLALAETVRRLSVIYAGLAVYGVVRRLIFPRPGLVPVWLALILINLLILMGSGAVISLVVDRYAIATALTIMLAVPFVLIHLYDRWRIRERRGRAMAWGFPALILICVWLGVKSLDVFTEKQYLVDAGRWISNNVQPDAAVYSNNLILIYYSGRDDYHDNDDYSWRQTRWLIKYDKWKDYDYIALQIDKQDDAVIEWLGRHLQRAPIQRFNNPRGDQLLVYRTDD